MHAVISVFELASVDQMARLIELHEKIDFFLFRVSDVSLKCSLLSIITFILHAFAHPDLHKAGNK